MNNNPVAIIRRIYQKTNFILKNCALACPGEEGDGGSGLTAFNVDLLADACNPIEAGPFPVVYYHDGAGQYPVLGDTVYEDAAGTMPASLQTFVDESPGGHQTDANGITVVLNCE